MGNKNKSVPKAALTVVFVVMMLLGVLPGMKAEVRAGEIFDATNLPGSGEVKLGADIELAKNWTFSGDASLDLNGHKLDLKGYKIKIFGGNFTLKDSGSGRHYYYIDSDGLAHVVDNEEDSNYQSAETSKKGSFEGGYITGNVDSTANYFGGAIHINGEEVNFTMDKGTIIGNRAGSGKYGGGIDIDEKIKKFTMNGGAIIGNVSAQGGGGIYFYSAEDFIRTPTIGSTTVTMWMAMIHIDTLSGYL